MKFKQTHMKNTTNPAPGILHFGGANAVAEASDWINKQTGWTKRSVEWYLLTHGLYVYKPEGEVLVRATMFDTHAPGVEVWFNTEHFS